LYNTGKSVKRVLRSLDLNDVRHLCKHLGTSPKELEHICDNPERYYIQGPRNIKGKVRHIATPVGRLRKILDKLQTLLQRLDFPKAIHGGRKLHSNFSNALPHVHKPIVIKLDLKDFFPSVKSGRVYEVFAKHTGCSPDVARYLTRLTTLNGCLPQGSPTSTILASLVIKPLAHRIERIAELNGATYTQYVDDITVSGPAHIKNLLPTILRIIKQEGFQENEKTQVINLDEEQIVTGVRVNNGPDAPSERIKEVRHLLNQTEIKKALGQRISEQEILSINGKIRNISRLNKGAGRYLRKRFDRIIRMKMDEFAVG